MGVLFSCFLLLFAFRFSTIRASFFHKGREWGRDGSEGREKEKEEMGRERERKKKGRKRKKEGRKEKRGREGGRKEIRRKGRKEEKREGRKEREKYYVETECEMTTIIKVKRNLIFIYFLANKIYSHCWLCPPFIN